MKMNGEDLSVLKEKKTKKTLLKIIITSPNRNIIHFYFLASLFSYKKYLQVL